LAPVPSSVDAYTSANSARDALNPTVLALAMLLPVTLKSLEAALSPLSAVLNDMVLPLPKGRY
jgi:hypothetical protein